VIGADGYRWQYVTSWITNTNYSLNAEVKSNNGHTYRCTIKPLRLATLRPVHVAGQVIGADGYGWTVDLGVPTLGWATGVDFQRNQIVLNTAGQSQTLADGYGWILLVGTPTPTPLRWVTGNDYAKGNRVMSSNGRYYECIIDPAATPGVSGVVAPVSANEPVHGAGEVIGADGFGWTFLTNAVATFTRYGATIAMETIATDVNITLTPGTNARHIRHTGTLTANRTVTLSTSGAYNGLVFRVTRTGGGAFTLNVGTGPLKAMPTASWAEFTYDGAAWYLSAYGTL
jgi:hypothetical protein